MEELYTFFDQCFGMDSEPNKTQLLIPGKYVKLSINYNPPSNSQHSHIFRTIRFILD